MHSRACINLQHLPKEDSVPPIWATGDQTRGFWYFENEHGEQWVAKRTNDELVVAGLDIGWKEISFTLEQVLKETKHIVQYIATGKAPQPTLPPRPKDVPEEVYAQVAASLESSEVSVPFSVGGWILDEAEILWLLAVFQAALPSMHLARKRK